MVPERLDKLNHGVFDSVKYAAKKHNQILNLSFVSIFKCFIINLIITQNLSLWLKNMGSTDRSAARSWWLEPGQG